MHLFYVVLSPCFVVVSCYEVLSFCASKFLVNPKRETTFIQQIILITTHLLEIYYISLLLNLVTVTLLPTVEVF